MTSPLRLGVVGYGAGGRWFHTPFVHAAAGIELAGVVARSHERGDQARSDWPTVPVFQSLEALLASGVDAVTITTPPDTHAKLALEAINAGVHVVVDKPFAPTVEEAEELIAAAETAGVMLSVYQNRRWDADIQTLGVVLDSGRIGTPWRLVSRMDQDNLETVHAGRGNGLLLDLGTHLIDQVVLLLGPVASVSASLYWVDLAEGRTEAAFVLNLVHASGVVSTVESTKAHRLAARELRVLGTSGAYVATSTDVQERAIKAGRMPDVDPASWGFEPPEVWGTLTTPDGEERVPSAQGRWQEFYTQFAAAARGDGPQPVPATEALHVLSIIAAARISARDGVRVAVVP